jgi:flagellar capping protein FliD
MSGTPTGQYGQYKLTVDSTGAITSVFTPQGGSALAAAAATLTGGANTTLISGMTINAGALPPAGQTLTDTIWVGGSGVLGRLDAYLTSSLGTAGLFQGETDSTNAQVRDLTQRINDMNVQLAQQQQTLQHQFTAMETALAQLNSQGSSLLASMGSASTSSSSSTSSTGR